MQVSLLPSSVLYASYLVVVLSTETLGPCHCVCGGTDSDNVLVVCAGGTALRGPYRSPLSRCTGRIVVGSRGGGDEASARSCPQNPLFAIRWLRCCCRSDSALRTTRVLTSDKAPVGNHPCRIAHLSLSLGSCATLSPAACSEYPENCQRAADTSRSTSHPLGLC